MAKRGATFGVDTSPDKVAVVDSLTRDVTVEACIFDLIDNSIDAARQINVDNFNGFEAKLSFSKTGFKIEDNCGGIKIDDLRDSVLRFGKRSSNTTGIGVFGVGLNRALFKLGLVSVLKTDTGKQRAELILDTQKYKSDNSTWELPAIEVQSTGKKGTEIEITRLYPEISQSFSQKAYVDRIRHEVGRRYGRFIERGFSILVDKIPARNEDIKIREDGPYPLQHKFLRAPESGVSVVVRYGEHIRHRFANETGYDRAVNSELSEEYGWTVFCNDRAIVVSDRTAKTGWDRFHTEFYGFVGEVNFVGDAAKLPWDTTKTDIDLNNSAYQLALAHMRKFAEEWRSTMDRRKKSKKEPQTPPPKTKPASPQKTKRNPAPAKPQPRGRAKTELA